MRYRGNRKTQREELELSWHAYDALRPIRKVDMESEPAAEVNAGAVHPPAGRPLDSAADSVSVELGKRRRAIKPGAGT